MSRKDEGLEPFGREDIADQVQDEAVLAAIKINSMLAVGSLIRPPLYAVLNGCSVQNVHQLIARKAIAHVRIGDQVFLPVKQSSLESMRRVIATTYPQEQNSQ